jgi:hypothetical protein
MAGWLSGGRREAAASDLLVGVATLLLFLVAVGKNPRIASWLCLLAPPRKTTKFACQRDLAVGDRLAQLVEEVYILDRKFM